MNLFDIIVIAVILLSGLFAFARGFVKETLSIAAWIGALIATIYLFPYAVPLAERFLPKGMIADIAAGATIFIVILIVFSVISSAIARRVKQSAFSAIDHTLGLLFGLVRGFVIACLLYLGITWALPDANQPQWIKEARSAPMLESGANTLRGMVPATLRSRAEATATEAAQKIDQARQADGAIRALTSPKAPDPPQSSDPPDKKGTASTDRRGLDRLFQQNSQQ